MKIKVKCEVCSKEQIVSPSRAKSYKTCGHTCSSIRKKGKPNCKCTNCNKKFHMKLSQQKRYNRNMGFFCSQKCSTEYKKSFYLGRNNPNFRGRQYSRDGYRINHYPKVGNIKEHRYVARTYLNLDKIPKNLIVHHRDCNIYNNIPENLVILNPSDHRWLHKQFGNATLWAYMNNKVSLEQLIQWSNDPIRTKKLIPLNLLMQKLSGVFKFCELLESPEEDNQQPSIVEIQ